MLLNSPRVRLNSDGTHGRKEFKCLLPSISFLATGHCCTIAKPVISLRACAVSNQHTAELVLFTYCLKHSKWSTSNGKIKHTRTRHVLGSILSLGPFCIQNIYIYIRYICNSKKTLSCWELFQKKTNRPKFSKQVCSHFAKPPFPPKWKKQYHWQW